MSLALNVFLVLPLSSSNSLHRSDLQGNFQRLRNEANVDFAAGRWQQARANYGEGLRLAERLGDNRNRSRFLTGIANCDYQERKWRPAIANYHKAEELAKLAGDWVLAGFAAFNQHQALAGTGDLESATSALLQSLAWFGRAPARQTPAMVLTAAARQAGDAGARGADELFHEAIARSEDDPVVQSLHIAWRSYGLYLLGQGRLTEAQSAFEQSLRVAVRLGPRERALSLHYLAETDLRAGRLAQGLVRNGEAYRLVATIRGQTLPPWRVLMQSARLHAARGERAAALDLFARAIAACQRWRAEVGVNMAGALTREGNLNELYEAYLSLVQSSGREDLTLQARTFELAEQLRALTWREQVQAQAPADQEYRQTVERLGGAEAEELSGGDGASERAMGLRRRLAELQSTKSVRQSYYFPDPDQERIHESSTLRHFQRHLKEGEALFSFNVGSERTTVWAVTRRNFEVATSAGSEQLSVQVKALNASIHADDSTAVAREGARLYSTLFGRLSKKIRESSDWILSIDKGLFELPFSALTDESGRFLVESHSLRVVPSAMTLLGRQVRKAPKRFVGYGDPVYNSADSRLSRWAAWRLGDSVLPGGGRPGGRPMELTRLPGSQKELEYSTRSLPRFQNVLLTGKTASRNRLLESMRNGVGILHFAGHVVQNRNRPEAVMMGLGLSDGWNADFLSPTEVMNMREKVGIVVLSGCGSAAGKALPGAGLLGLTRSWLVAGAQAVTAALWPTADDSGVFFQSFYKFLIHDEGVQQSRYSSAGTARALQQAQIEMLRSNSWRSAPRYWAPYLVVGRD